MGKLTIDLSHCTVCDKKKSTFIKNQELNNFIYIYIIYIYIYIYNIYIYIYTLNNIWNDKFKMNKTLTNVYWLETNLCQNCI